MLRRGTWAQVILQQVRHMEAVSGCKQVSVVKSTAKTNRTNLRISVPSPSWLLVLLGSQWAVYSSMYLVIKFCFILISSMPLLALTNCPTGMTFSETLKTKSKNKPILNIHVLNNKSSLYGLKRSKSFNKGSISRYRLECQHKPINSNFMFQTGDENEEHNAVDLHHTASAPNQGCFLLRFIPIGSNSESCNDLYEALIPSFEPKISRGWGSHTVSWTLQSFGHFHRQSEMLKCFSPHGDRK